MQSGSARNYTFTERNVTSVRRFAVHVIQAACAVYALAALFVDGPLGHSLATVAAACALFTLFVGVVFGRRAVAELDDHLRLIDEAREARSQVEELFAMTDMLQATEDHDDAGAVLMITAVKLLPGFGGAFYVFNNSRDRLDLAKSWGLSGTFEPAAALVPNNCWALKRGKPHINDPASGTLCCMHQIGTGSTVEVPMMARGQVFGLLLLASDAPDALERFTDIRRVARALADSMSLALSNTSACSMSIMLSSWLRNSSSLRGAGFFGGIDKPHHVDPHTESRPDPAEKP